MYICMCVCVYPYMHSNFNCSPGKRASSSLLLQYYYLNTLRIHENNDRAHSEYAELSKKEKEDLCAQMCPQQIVKKRTKCA